MGQYYKIVNLDKKEYLWPHDCDDGAKLTEFGNGPTMLCLAALLADGNNRGSGDIPSDNPIIGSWAGDRIVIAGDYADPGKFIAPEDAEQTCNLYSMADTYKNISATTVQALKDAGEWPADPARSLRPDMFLTPVPESGLEEER